MNPSNVNKMYPLLYRLFQTIHIHVSLGADIINYKTCCHGFSAW